MTTHDKYCPGENCQKREQCAMHQLSNLCTNFPSLNDWSTYCIDNKYECGDNSESYSLFIPKEIKKQYWRSPEHNFKRRVILFEDGKPVTYYAGFGAEEFIEQAESEGYVKGYLQEDLEEARIVYERVKDNVLPIGYKELWELEEKMKNEES